LGFGDASDGPGVGFDGGVSVGFGGGVVLEQPIPAVSTTAAVSFTQRGMTTPVRPGLQKPPTPKRH